MSVEWDRVEGEPSVGDDNVGMRSAEVVQRCIGESKVVGGHQGEV